MTTLPDAPWRHWDGLGALLEALGAGEGRTRFVGGAVRDTLLGLAVTDVDLATALPPSDVVARIEGAGLKAVPTGLKHGTVTAVIGGKRPIEVTTLRRDVATDGRHAEIEYTDDWQEDAARRDFTINALSADPASGQIYDYFGGLDDLESRSVRFIGDPLERIAEDHLRILRFFRFHARFGEGAPDAAGLAAAKRRANDLMALSRERIADELLKTLAIADPAPTIALMIEHGILAPVLPEIENTVTLERVIGREQRFGRDAVSPELVEGRRESGAEGALTLRQAQDERRSGPTAGPAEHTAPSPVRRLAALLPADPETARGVAGRLKLSNADRKRIAIAAARMPGDTAAPRALAHRLGIESAVDRLLLCNTNDIVVGRALATLAENPPPAFPLKGGDLIAMGVEAGPEVSRLLREIEEAWIAEDFPGEERVRTIAGKLIKSSRSR